MKRVLVPVDFSEASIKAFSFGIELANLLKADLRFMHVVTGKHYAPVFEDSSDMKLSGQAYDWMEKLKQENERKYKVPGGKFDYKIREGNVTKEITNQAKYDDSSIIVLGSHGISGFEDKWIGSNAYRLVISAPCPVLLIRKSFEQKAFKKIVMPVDIKKSSRLKVPVIAGVAKLFQAKVYVVGLKETNFSSILNSIRVIIHQVEHYLKDFVGVETESAILTGKNLPRKLLEYSASIDADLIAIQINHDSNPFSDLIKPFANEIINYADRPVLVVPTIE